MRLVLVFLLIFTVLADFSIASYDAASCESFCDEATACVDHLASQEPSDRSDSNDTHTCHSHAGHSHAALINFLYSDLMSEASSNLVQFPKYQNKNTSSYLSEISRPPIS